ncbi:hypothetical protein N9O33_00515 [Gammaproteobacteria bacterium]|nr:hypothetical protein [Gammaproteobacteria bacterium]MDA9300776.1 hypothetical protein [bacterium]
MNDTADCEVIGRDYALIPEGEYEVVLESWETSSRFSRKDKDDPSLIKGGKLYLWFRVDPYSQTLDSEVMLFMAMNVNSLVLPTGENGKFKVGARSKYYKTLKRLFGEKATEIARSPKLVRGKVLVARVRTVKTDDKQRKHSEEEWYSVIDELIDLG